MRRNSPRLSSAARVAVGALSAVAISVVWQPLARASTPTTHAAASACTATSCLFREVGQSVLHIPAGVGLLHVDVIGANQTQVLGKPATSTTAPEGTKGLKNIEVQGNLALTPGETALEVVLAAPDSLGGRRSIILSPGTSTARPLVAAGGTPRTATTLPTTTIPSGSGITYGETVVPPGGIAKYSSKPPGVIVSWVPPGTSPVFVSATRAYLKEGADQALTVTAEGPTPPTLVEHGALPNGTAWKDNGNGTATLTGTPVVSGVYPLTITATDSEGRSTSQRLNLIISKPVPSKTGKRTNPPPTTSVPPTSTHVHPAPRTISPSASSPPVTTAPVTTAPVTTAPVTTAPVTSPPTSARPTVTPAPTPTAPPASTKTSRPKNKSAEAPVAPRPTITSPARATFVDNSPASFRITASPLATVRLTEHGVLPPGVVFTAESHGTATVSGRPTKPGTYPVTVTASSTSGVSATQVLTLTVIQTPAVTSPSTATFTTGTAGGFTITATGSPAPTLTEQGALPAGLTFHANNDGTATITGTPSQPGEFPLTITAQNGQAATQTLTLSVTQAPSVTSPTTATFTTGTAGTFTITATGTPTPTLAQQGALPAGLTFHANTNGTATLGGTPTGDGVYPITVTASNEVGAAFTQHLSVDVTEAPSITTPGSATFTRSRAGTFTIVAVGWPTPALSVQGALPPGLAFRDNADGSASLTGTPTQAGNYLFDVTAENRIGAPSIQQVKVAVLLTPTTIKLSSRRLGATATQNTLGLTAVVDPPGSVPTGTVTFFDRGHRLGSSALDNLGAATLTVKVPLGNHQLTASYDPASGSGFAASSTTPLGFVATPAPAAASTNRPSTNRGPLATTGAQIRLALEIGGALVLLGAAVVWVSRLRRRRPGRPAA